MDRGDDFVLLKVLGEASYKRIAPAGRDPLSRRERGPALFPDRSSEIIA
jgi:hypothetical protein